MSQKINKIDIFIENESSLPQIQKENEHNQLPINQKFAQGLKQSVSNKKKVDNEEDKILQRKEKNQKFLQIISDLGIDYESIPEEQRSDEKIMQFLESKIEKLRLSRALHYEYKEQQISNIREQGIKNIEQQFSSGKTKIVEVENAINRHRDHLQKIELLYQQKQKNQDVYQNLFDTKPLHFHPKQNEERQIKDKYILKDEYDKNIKLIPQKLKEKNVSTNKQQINENLQQLKHEKQPKPLNDIQFMGLHIFKQIDIKQQGVISKSEMFNFIASNEDALKYFDVTDKGMLFNILEDYKTDRRGLLNAQESMYFWEYYQKVSNNKYLKTLINEQANEQKKVSTEQSQKKTSLKVTQNIIDSLQEIFVSVDKDNDFIVKKDQYLNSLRSNEYIIKHLNSNIINNQTIHDIICFFEDDLKEEYVTWDQINFYFQNAQLNSLNDCSSFNKDFILILLKDIFDMQRRVKENSVDASEFVIAVRKDPQIKASKLNLAFLDELLEKCLQNEISWEKILYYYENREQFLKKQIQREVQQPISSAKQYNILSNMLDQEIKKEVEQIKLPQKQDLQKYNQLQNLDELNKKEIQFQSDAQKAAWQLQQSNNLKFRIPDAEELKQKYLEQDNVKNQQKKFQEDQEHEKKETIRQRKLRQMIDEKQKEEEDALHFKFRANKIPDEVSLPIYETLKAQQNQRRADKLEKYKEKVIKEMMPFNFQQAKNKERTQLEVQQNLSEYKAKPVPSHISDKNRLEKMQKQQGEKRKKRIEERKEWLEKNTQEPSKMKEHEQKRKEKLEQLINKTNNQFNFAPSIKPISKQIQQMIDNNKQEKQNTKPQQLEFLDIDNQQDKKVTKMYSKKSSLKENELIEKHKFELDKYKEKLEKQKQKQEEIQRKNIAFGPNSNKIEQQKVQFKTTKEILEEREKLKQEDEEKKIKKEQKEQTIRKKEMEKVMQRQIAEKTKEEQFKQKQQERLDMIKQKQKIEKMKSHGSHALQQLRDQYKIVEQKNDDVLEYGNYDQYFEEGNQLKISVDNIDQQEQINIDSNIQEEENQIKIEQYQEQDLEQNQDSFVKEFENEKKYNESQNIEEEQGNPINMEEAQNLELEQNDASKKDLYDIQQNQSENLQNIEDQNLQLSEEKIKVDQNIGNIGDFEKQQKQQNQDQKQIENQEVSAKIGENEDLMQKAKQEQKRDPNIIDIDGFQEQDFSVEISQKEQVETQNQMIEQNVEEKEINNISEIPYEEEEFIVSEQQEKEIDKQICSQIIEANSQVQASKQIQTILQKLKSQGKTLYEDNEFKANIDSLSKNINHNYYNSLFKEAEWIRPSILFNTKEVKLFDKIEASDVKQGIIGNCYFLATLSALAEFPSIVKKLFNTSQSNEFGVYSINFVINGLQTEVIIDDRIPSKDRIPLFSKPAGNELWVLLLEKAWAKTFGSYDQIEGGLPHEAMELISGAPVKGYNIQKDFTESQNQFEKYLMNMDKNNYIICVGSKGQGEEIQNGIVQGHAYTIITVYNVNSNQTILCKIRNPWGKTEFQGEYQEHSLKWTSELKKLTNFESTKGDDGLFFMTSKELQQYFDLLSVCFYKQEYKFSSITHIMQQKHAAYFTFQLLDDEEEINIRAHQKHLKLSKENSYQGIIFQLFKYTSNDSLESEYMGEEAKYWGNQSIWISESPFIKLSKGKYLIKVKYANQIKNEQELTLSTYCAQIINFCLENDKKQIKKQLDKYYIQKAIKSNEIQKIHEKCDLCIEQFDDILIFYCSNKFQLSDAHTLSIKCDLTNSHNLQFDKKFSQSPYNIIEINCKPQEQKIAIIKKINRNDGYKLDSKGTQISII